MKRLLDIEAAASYCGVCPTVFARHIPVKPIKLGRRRVWDIVAIDRWIEAQQTFVLPANDDANNWRKLLDEAPRNQKGSVQR